MTGAEATSAQQARWPAGLLIGAGLLASVGATWATPPWSQAPALLALSAGLLVLCSSRLRLLAVLPLLVTLGALALSWPPAESRPQAVLALMGACGLLARLGIGSRQSPLLAAVAGAALLLVAGIELAAGATRGPGGSWLPALLPLPAIMSSAVWLAAPLLRARTDELGRVQRLAVAVQAGVAGSVALGWLLGSALIVQGATTAVPMQFNTALCHLLAAASLALALRRTPRWPLLLQLPVVLFAIASLIEEALGAGSWVGQLLLAHGLTAEGVPPGRMAPNTAIGFLVGALAVAMMLPAQRHPRLWIGVWAAGFLIIVIALIVGAGYLLQVPGTRAIGELTPMALMTALAFAGYGIGLLFAGRDHMGGATHQTFWLPVLVFAGSVIFVLQLWSAAVRQRDALADHANQLRADAIAREVDDALGARIAALRRQAERLAREDVERAEQVFRADAEANLRDFPSIRALLWIERDRRVRWRAARATADGQSPDGAIDSLPQWRSALDAVVAGAPAHLSDTFTLADSAERAVLMLPLDTGGSAPRVGYLAADIDYRVLLGDSIRGELRQSLRIRDGDTVLFEHSVPVAADPGLRRAVSQLNRRYEIEVWPPPAAGVGRLAVALLLGGIAAGGWLALSLRFSGLAGLRAKQLESSRQALQRELSEGERMRSALDATERELGSVLESITDAVLLLDRDWRLTYLNPQGARLLRRRRDEIVGKVIWDEFPEARDGPFHDAYRRAIREQTTVVLESFYPPLDAWFEVRAYPHRGGVAVYFHDVSVAKRAERERAKHLAESERAQRLAQLGSWELELASGRLHWSKQTREILGVALADGEESIDALLQLVHPDDREALREMHARLLAGLADLDIEFRICRSDGSERYVRELGALVRDADGQALLAAGAIQDITERRRAEDALRESTRRLERALTLNRMIMANSLDAICVFDSEGRFTAVSAASEALWGYAPEELIGQPFIDLVLPEDRELTLAANAGILTGAPLIDFRNRYLAKGGRVVDMQWSAVWSEADQLIVTVARDVTELQRRDAELRELRDSLLRAQQIAAMGSWELLIDANRLNWSDEIYRIFDVGTDAFAGNFEAFVARIHPQDREAVLAAQARALAGAGELDIEHRIVLADGGIRHVHERARLLCDAEGRPWRLAGSVQDITARKRAELLEQGQRAILAGIAARLPVPDSLAAIAHLCEQQHPQGLCAIHLLDDAGGRLLTGAAPSLSDAYSKAIHGQPIGPRAGSCGTAAWRGERVVVTDIASDPLWVEYAALAQSHGLRACWSTPVTSSDGRVLATFATYYREPGAPDDAELASVEGMAALAAVAIEQGRAYTRLADSEQRFRSLFAEHPDAVFSMDLAGRFTACNQGFERITGVSAERSLGEFFDEGITPRQRPAVRANFTAAARGEARSYETQALFPDGRQFDLRVTNLPIMIDGRVTGVFGIAQDITLLRQRERDLAAALSQAQMGSEQLRRLSAAAVVMSQSSAGADLYQQLVDELRETVQAHQAVIMLTEPAAGGKATFSVSLSSKYDAYRERAAVPRGSAIYAAVVESNQPLRLTQAELEAHPGWREFGSEATHQPPMRGWLAVPLLGSDGRNLGVLQLSDKAAGEFGEDDEAIAVQFAQMASTAIERRALITRLSDNEERLRAIMQTAAEGILTIDESGTIESANPETMRIFGYSEGELVGQNVRMLMPEPFHSEHDGYLARYVSTGEARIIGIGREVVGRRRDGSVFPIDLSVSELKLADRRRFSGFVRDITERRRIARALQQAVDDLRMRNRELQDFAFVASHDLQEPLRKIRAFTDRVQTRCAGQLDDTARDYLSRASQAAARMQVLIDDLLTLSRVSSRGRPFVEVDLNALAAGVLEDLVTRLESSGGRVELGPLPTLTCDATQLRQLLQNLISNALKFRSPLRPPQVQVSATAALLDGERPGWEIRVCDNGIGFEPKYAERIFAPFQRLHGRQEYEGTGIGLAIVRRIVERHRGSIHAEGRPDQGACFVVLLPAQQPEPPLANAEPRLQSDIG